MKYLSSILILGSLVFLTGCDSADTIIEENRYLCNEHGGVEGLSTGKSWPRLILCNDRTVKWIGGGGYEYLE